MNFKHIAQVFDAELTKKNGEITLRRTGYNNLDFSDLTELSPVLYKDDKEAVLSYGEHPEKLSVDENGLRHGMCIQFRHGNIVLEREYEHGVRHGTTTAYFAELDSDTTPPILYQTHYKDGKKHGTHVVYDRWGNISVSQEWANGELIGNIPTVATQTPSPQSQTRYGYTGAIVAEWMEVNPKPDFKPNLHDKKYYYDRYNITGKIIGEMRLFNHVGNHTKTVCFVDGNSQHLS